MISAERRDLVRLGVVGNSICIRINSRSGGSTKAKNLNTLLYFTLESVAGQPKLHTHVRVVKFGAT